MAAPRAVRFRWDPCSRPETKEETRVFPSAREPRKTCSLTPTPSFFFFFLFAVRPGSSPAEAVLPRRRAGRPGEGVGVGGGEQEHPDLRSAEAGADELFAPGARCRGERNPGARTGRPQGKERIPPPPSFGDHPASHRELTPLSFFSVFSPQTRVPHLTTGTGLATQAP